MSPVVWLMQAQPLMQNPKSFEAESPIILLTGKKLIDELLLLRKLIANNWTSVGGGFFLPI